MTLRIPALLLMGALLLSPSFASAATKKPTCELTVTTPKGKTSVRDEKTIGISSGDSVTIAWNTKNASKVLDGKSEVDEEGTKTFTVATSQTHTLTVSSGKKKETCEVTLAVTGATLSTTALGTKDKKLSGTAEGSKEVKVYVTKDGKKVYTSKDLKVKKGKWSTSMKKALPAGTYTLEIKGDKGVGTMLSTTLTVGQATGGGAISASLVPLLMGGTARANEAAPVFYLKLQNTGKAPATISGVTMRQTGSAPTSAISYLTIIDEKGGSSGNSGTNAFKNGSARIPTSATLAPGEMRLFTMRAVMSPSALSYLGTQVALELTGIESSGGASGKFPIRGTTLTIGY